MRLSLSEQPLSPALTGTWLFFCSIDSPLDCKAVAHLFSIKFQGRLDPPPPLMARYLTSLSWCWEVAKISYIVSKVPG